MVKKFTLRKISKLVSKIDREIHELSHQVNTNVVAAVVVHDHVSDMLTKVSETRSEWTLGFNTLLSLVGARVTLRDELGSANQSAGINHLVTELRGQEQKLSIVDQIIRSSPKETQLSNDALQRRMEARREAPKNATIDVSGYGLANRGTKADEASLPVLTDEDVGDLEARQKAIRDSIESMHDKLEQLNVAVTIELADDLVKELQYLEII